MIALVFVSFSFYYLLFPQLGYISICLDNLNCKKLVVSNKVLMGMIFYLLLKWSLCLRYSSQCIRESCSSHHLPSYLLSTISSTSTKQCLSGEGLSSLNIWSMSASQLLEPHGKLSEKLHVKDEQKVPSKVKQEGLGLWKCKAKGNGKLSLRNSL